MFNFSLFVIAVLSILYILNQKENALLKSFGLKASNKYKYFRRPNKIKLKIDIPPSSQFIMGFQSYFKPITSVHNRNLFIFTWITPYGGMPPPKGFSR